MTFNYGGNTMQFYRATGYSLMWLSLVLFPGGCGKQPKGTPVVTWLTDATVVSRVLPVLEEVQSCAWHEGVAEDRSGGMVPGPSAYFLRGYAVVSPVNVEKLMTTYQWIPSQVQPSDLDLPPGSLGYSPGGKLLESPDLIQNLPGLSAYHEGRVLLCPDDGFVYFDLIKD